LWLTGVAVDAHRVIGCPVIPEYQQDDLRE
jgi:hypothetical protein